MKDKEATESFLFTIVNFIKIGWLVRFENPRSTKGLLKELQTHVQSHGFSLSQKHVKRITYYTLQSSITNNWFSLLRGYKPSKTELKNALYMGAFTPVMDDLMDNSGKSFESLIQSQEGNTVEFVLFKYLYGKLEVLIQSNPDFGSYFHRAHEAQNESLKQLQVSELSVDELVKITCDKGGYYTTLYRTVLQNELKEGEADAIYLLGSLMQIFNDLFDTYKDNQAGLQTLITAHRDVKMVNNLVVDLIKEFKGRYAKLDYSKKDIRKSYLAIRNILGMGLVGVNQYLALQGTSAKLDIESFERKQLIVDLDIWPGIKSTVLEIHKLGALN